MIRPYEAADLEDLLQTWAAASRTAHPFLSKELRASERENIPKVYLPMAATWVYEAGMGSPSSATGQVFPRIFQRKCSERSSPPKPE